MIRYSLRRRIELAAAVKKREKGRSGGSCSSVMSFLGQTGE